MIDLILQGNIPKKSSSGYSLDIAAISSSKILITNTLVSLSLVRVNLLVNTKESILIRNTLHIDINKGIIITIVRLPGLIVWRIASKTLKFFFLNPFTSLKNIISNINLTTKYQINTANTIIKVNKNDSKMPPTILIYIRKIQTDNIVD